jgi:N6-L-threonylcarbamoyladenine synthase
VAANEAVRQTLQRVALEAGTALVVPPPRLCTDNGAMIAWAGAERLALGLTDTLEAAAHARWPLSEVRGVAAVAGAEVSAAGQARAPASGQDAMATRNGKLVGT